MLEKLFEIIAGQVLPIIEDKGWDALSPKMKSVVGVIASAEKTEFIAAALKTSTTLDEKGLELIYEDIQKHFEDLGKPMLVGDIDSVVQIEV